jgi:TPR repeat protein
MPLAQAYVSFFYREGLAGAPSITFNYAKLAVEAGCIDGKRELAQCYQHGVGCEVDEVKAIELYKGCGDHVSMFIVDKFLSLI